MTDDARDGDRSPPTPIDAATVDGDGGAEVLLRLPDALRPALREPLGPLRQSVSAVPSDTEVVAVGDIVAYHLAEAGRRPSVAVVDRRTQREAVDPDVEAAVLADDRRRITVDNPAGTITDALVTALVDAVADPAPVVVLVDGEEDLAVLPAVLVAAEGASVLYGQPGEGLVHVTVDADARATVRELLSRMAGDEDCLWTLLEG